MDIIKREYKKVILSFLSFLFLGLYVIPYYNFWYRKFVIISLNLLVPIFILASAAGIIKNIISRSYIGIIIYLLILVGIIIGYLNIYDIRVKLTRKIIQDNYCNRTVENIPQKILGGIEKFSYHNGYELIESKSFYNESHCFITVCSEEFYYCE